MKNSARTRAALLGASLVVLAVAGCSDDPILDPGPASTTPAAPSPAGTESATDPAPTDPEEPADGDEPDPEPTEPAVATVPGYAVGAFPSVPMFVLPDLALFDDDLASDATRELNDDLAGLAGVTVSRRTAARTDGPRSASRPRCSTATRTATSRRPTDPRRATTPAPERSR